MNQVAVVDEMSRSMVEIENTRKVCEMLMKTPHYAKMGQEGIFAIVSKARSLGMEQIEALNGGLYYVQGKVGMPAETMAALIRQKGHSIIKDAKSNDQVCILHGKRADNGDTWTVSFSMQDAERAGLAKNMYQKYPGAMLYNRAMSFLARQLFPDIIKGAGYTLDELKEIALNKPDINVIENKYESDIEMISKEQADELSIILSDCASEYKKQVMDFLKKQSINSIDELPITLYDRVKNAALKKREEYQKSLELQESNEALEDKFEEVINA